MSTLNPATRTAALLAIALGTAGLRTPCRAAPAAEVLSDDFGAGSLVGWHAREGRWSAEEGRAVARGGFGMLLHRRAAPRDFEASALVTCSHADAHAAAGLAFRYSEADGTGYLLGLREVERGDHPEFGPWERPVLQLHRLDKDGWKLLQESKVERARSGVPVRLKVTCRGPDVWAFCEDMETPVLAEYDPEYDRGGAVGLWKDQLGVARFDDFAAGPPPAALPPAPSRADWSRVRGAVYVRSDAVNSVQMWHDYWGHTDVLDRELSYAALYGFNMVQVYLHWIVWDAHGEEYLRRIDDFLARAAKYKLRANLILWDDCGHVEPSLAFGAPVPGRHNSQMMPNPSHAIRDDAARLAAHEGRFRGYVLGVVGRFKDDPRIDFWQLYNEPLGPRERSRDGTADGNLNRLLGWTRTWAKATGTRIPVTATGGGFYGPKYSDFYSYHSYASGAGPLPNADGGPEHLCTETLNRPAADLARCVRELGGKRDGFVAWELMIGRDNCRFPWGHPDGPDEPAAPFHGIIHPDGHPWDVREVEALLGDDRFAALQEKVFRVEYFDGEFAASRKVSITPRIDFELGDEPGTGSPDASAGIGRDHFSIRWAGRVVAPATGTYTVTGSSDGVLRAWVGEAKVIDKGAHGRGEAVGDVALTRGESYPFRAEYVHRAGEAGAHLVWSGPGIAKGPLVPRRE